MLAIKSNLDHIGFLVSRENNLEELDKIHSSLQEISGLGFSTPTS